MSPTNASPAFSCAQSTDGTICVGLQTSWDPIELYKAIRAFQSSFAPHTRAVLTLGRQMLWPKDRWADNLKLCTMAFRYAGLTLVGVDADSARAQAVAEVLNLPLVTVELAAPGPEVREESPAAPDEAKTVDASQASLGAQVTEAEPPLAEAPVETPEPKAVVDSPVSEASAPEASAPEAATALPIDAEARAWIDAIVAQAQAPFEQVAVPARASVGAVGQVLAQALEGTGVTVVDGPVHPGLTLESPTRWAEPLSEPTPFEEPLSSIDEPTHLAALQEAVGHQFQLDFTARPVGQGPQATSPEPAAAPATEALAESMETSSEPPRTLGALRHTERVRSGQQVYAEGRDLVVENRVSSAAEVTADGSVHVHGLIEGQVRAGVRGDLTATIYCLNFKAQLVAIGPYCQIFEEIPKALEGKAVRFWFDEANEVLRWSVIQN